MARMVSLTHIFALLFLFMVVVAVEGAPKKPKKVKCKDKRFTNCYKKDLFCPDACLRTCVVDCSTCQPVCTRPPPPPTPPPPPPRRRPRRSPPPPPPTVPNSPPPSVPIPPSISSPPPPPSVPLTPPSLSPPPPSTTPSLSPPFVPPPPPSSEASAVGRARCRNKNFPNCNGIELTCPVACPQQCTVDCVTCSPVCECNKPGAVCQDPRFVGGDGITFYFHGKKDRDFCLLSDSNLHINGHFIGKRNTNMTRDFTWVQSIGILFDTHRLYIGAKKTATWDDAVDRLSLSLDGEPILLPEAQTATWQSTKTPTSVITITRSRDTNSVVINLEGNLRIKATVVPITKKDSEVHNYGVTEEDCFAHLDLSFKFYSLSGEVSGLLGQTYASSYVSRVKMGVTMPVLGGEKEFAASSIFAADCAAARFEGRSHENDSSKKFEFDNLHCGSGMDGRGVVCKR